MAVNHDALDHDRAYCMTCDNRPSESQPACTICYAPSEFKLWVGEQDYPSFLCNGCFTALVNFHEARDRGCTKRERVS